MTKMQARALINVLSLKRIPFTWRREGSAHIVSFNHNYVEIVKEAIGA